MNRARVAAGVALAIVALSVAVAISATPFHDVNVSCSAPVVAAVHGRRAVLVPSSNGGRRYVALSDAQVRFLTTTPTVPGIDGFPKFTIRVPAPRIVVLCREPARRRAGYALVLLGLALLGVGIARGRRVRRAPEPPLSELTLASGAA